MSQTLKQRTFGRAAKWSYIQNWGDTGITALVTFFLAAILGPGDFGTVSMALIYTGFIQMFLDQGLVAALIQRKELRPDHLYAVFWMVLAASLGLVTVSVLLSGWWAGVNHLPRLAMVICALSICIPIEGLTLVQRAVLQREMDFKSLSIRGNLSALVGGVVGLVMAARGFGVWSLVGQQLGKDLTGLAVLWTVSHWRPRWRFSGSHFKELLSFSMANFGAKLGVFAYSQFDSVFIGMFFGPVAVGLYRLAERLVNVVLGVASGPLQTVSFSQFSRVQDQPQELRRSVLSCIRISSTMTVPALVGLAMASNLVVAVIGDKWAMAADPLKVLCIYGLAFTFGQFFGPLLQALGRPHYLAILMWTLAAVGAGLLITVRVFLEQASTRQQVLGIAAARATIGVLLFTVLVIVVKRFCGISLRDLATTIGPSALAAGAVTLVVVALTATGFVRNVKPVVGLIAEACLGGLAAAGTLLASSPDFKVAAAGFVSTLFRREKPV